MKDDYQEAPMTQAQLHGCVGGVGVATKLEVNRTIGHRPGLFRMTPGFLRHTPFAGTTPKSGGCGPTGCST